jgi:hypothetical protein
MKTKAGSALLALLLTLSGGGSTLAEMTSESYRISSAVLSGGATFAESASYAAMSTLGQPSPVGGTFAPPQSSSYRLHPGFWYTVMAPLVACAWDFGADGDVDGADAALFANGFFDSMDLSSFAMEFGRTNCLLQ